VLAWLISPRSRKHPYLLYTALLSTAGGIGVDYAAAQGWLAAPLQVFERRAIDTEAVRDVDVSEGEDEEVLLGQGGEEVNGEVVRRKVEGMRGRESVRAKVLGFGFAIGILGLWGDGA
jgi:autophagy-related protein 33